MRAIITVTGPDRVGIIAKASALLMECNVNILDLSQTIMGGLFTMTLLVDVSEASCSFDELKEKLTAHGEKENLAIRVIREDTFTAMHRV